MNQAAVIGIDIGTSGVRVVALDAAGNDVGSGSYRFPDPQSATDPDTWWAGVVECFAQLNVTMELGKTLGVSVDGTSGSLVALDANGRPLGVAMYNEPVRSTSIIASIERHAPPSSPARGATSPIGKAVELFQALRPSTIVHQADWIAMQLGSGLAFSDENNALKTGYDLDSASWPDWLERMGLPISILPEVRPAGSPLSPVGTKATALGLPSTCQLFAGTTDGCASFLATGAEAIGEGVTALGSSLVLKLLSDHRIEAPKFGVYSHRIGDMWLAGGASNTGGAVINAYFPEADLDALTQRVDPDRPTGLSYYPLLRPGERFPISDPNLKPVLTPRPDDPAIFFQAILEGIAEVEAEGFRRLRDLGAPALTSVRTVGGGAANQKWQRIRSARLGVPALPSKSVEAAFGVARLALRGLQNA